MISTETTQRQWNGPPWLSDDDDVHWLSNDSLWVLKWRQLNCISNIWMFSAFYFVSAYCGFILLLTPTTVAWVKRSSVCVCVHTIEPKRLKLQSPNLQSQINHSAKRVVARDRALRGTKNIYDLCTVRYQLHISIRLAFHMFWFCYFKRLMVLSKSRNAVKQFIVSQACLHSK